MQAGKVLVVLDENELRRELDKDEVVLWSAQPDVAASARAGLTCYFIAVPWIAASIYWTWTTSAPLCSGQHLDDIAWTLLAGSLLGLFLGLAVLGEPLWASQRAKRTIYAVTDSRILILRFFGARRTVQSFLRISIAEMERTERADGSGNLTFIRQPWRDGDRDLHFRTETFTHIANVREVENLVRKTFS